MPATTRPKVLIVEDDSGVAYLQQRAIERAGHEVFVASTGEQARDLIDVIAIDLIVLDYRLNEDRTGLDFYQELKTAGYDLPVIMVTGFSQESTVIQALRQGVRDFVAKSPEYLEYLPEAVQRVLKQVEMEQLLRASEAKFRSVSESARDAIVAIDEQGTIISWNAGACKAFGYSADEVLGQAVQLLMPERYREGHRKGLQRARTTGELRLVGKPVELLGLRKDGSEFPLEVCLGTWQSDGQRYFSGVIRDITERKQTEEAIRLRDQQLRHSQKMEALGTLAGGVAHEFNNLLQAILGYTRFAMEGLDETDQRRQDLAQVITAADRAAVLTRQLLDFGRRRTLERTTLDPNQVVRELVKMLRPLIGSNIELVVELAKDCGPIDADAGQLQQVLLNLCLNARDAMPSGGRLTIKTAKVTIRHGEQPHAADENLVSIRVSDTGCGMPAEVRQRIFEPFFTTKEVGKGSGLGLAVAYSLVQQQGGDLQVDSQPGQGSTFTVLLPIARDQVSTRSSGAMPVAKGGTELVLVAEDEPMLNNFIVKLLEKVGYRTLSAFNGQDAVRLFEDNPDVALVIVDVMMPGLGGYEACEAIQALRPGTPVLLCSGRFPDNGRPDSVHSGEVELIQKPVEPTVLLTKVRHALDTRATIEQEPGKDRHLWAPTTANSATQTATLQVN